MTHAIRDRWQYLPIALAIAVGLSQIYLARSKGLTPSKGGGFGLFSTVDKLENRNLRAYLLTDEGDIPFAIPRNVPAGEPLWKPIYQAASLPIEQHQRTLANELLAKPYEIPIKGVRVEVWKIAFDSAPLKATRLKVSSLTVHSGQHDAN